VDLDAVVWDGGEEVEHVGLGGGVHYRPQEVELLLAPLGRALRDAALCLPGARPKRGAVDRTLGQPCDVLHFGVGARCQEPGECGVIRHGGVGG